MTLSEFCSALEAINNYAPGLDARFLDMEILLSDGYCQVLVDGKVIAASDKGDAGGWDVALENALQEVKKMDFSLFEEIV